MVLRVSNMAIAMSGGVFAAVFKKCCHMEERKYLRHFAGNTTVASYFFEVHPPTTPLKDVPFVVTGGDGFQIDPLLSFDTLSKLIGLNIKTVTYECKVEPRAATETSSSITRPSAFDVLMERSTAIPAKKTSR